MDTNKFEIETADGVKSFDLNCDYDLRCFCQAVRDMGGSSAFGYFDKDDYILDSDDPIKLLLSTRVILHGDIDDNSFMIRFNIEDLKFKVINSYGRIWDGLKNYNLIIGENKFSTLDFKGDHSCKMVLYNELKNIKYRVSNKYGECSFKLDINDIDS